MWHQRLLAIMLKLPTKRKGGKFMKKHGLFFGFFLGNKFVLIRRNEIEGKV
jgi:hypothetical protein